MKAANKAGESGAAEGAVAVVAIAVCSAEVFEWNAVQTDLPLFDLVLACDVLYEVGRCRL